MLNAAQSMVEDDGVAVDTKPCERKAGGNGSYVQKIFKVIAALVAEITGYMTALG